MDEEKQNLSEAEEVAAMLATRGWASVKAVLDQKILDLQNIANIDTSTPDKMQADIRARLMAVDFLYAWLKNDVYGKVEQQRAAHERVVENTEGNYIERLPEKK